MARHDLVFLVDVDNTLVDNDHVTADLRRHLIAEVGRRHPGIGRLRLVVGRSGEVDTMVLRAESAERDRTLEAAVADTLRSVTKLSGTVELVGPGALPNDGKVIEDTRSV